VLTNFRRIGIHGLLLYHEIGNDSPYQSNPFAKTGKLFLGRP